MDTYNARLVQLRQERKDLVDERIRLKNKVSEAEAAYVEADERLTVKIHEISLTEQERSDVYHKAKRQKRWDAGEDIDV